MFYNLIFWFHSRISRCVYVIIHQISIASHSIFAIHSYSTFHLDRTTYIYIYALECMIWYCVTDHSISSTSRWTYLFDIQVPFDRMIGKTTDLCEKLKNKLKQVITTCNLIEKTTNLYEKLKNKLRYVVRCSPSAHFYEYMSSIILYYLWNFFLPLQKKKKKISRGKSQKVRVNLTTCLSLFPISHTNQRFSLTFSNQTEPHNLGITHSL